MNTTKATGRAAMSPSRRTHAKSHKCGFQCLESADSTTAVKGGA
ncbi:hypothetical protein P4C99_08490 [Pontiellaceae bacterium B1224]|nr:hypothetical protein [Pontiellaceae bacterium B1224]